MPGVKISEDMSGLKSHKGNTLSVCSVVWGIYVM